MKKIVSLMALCVVLFGTVMTVTGCGNKPNKDSVWETTKVNGVAVPEVHTEYWCFHSDANLYKVTKSNMSFTNEGKYTIDDATKKITITTTRWGRGGTPVEIKTTFNYTITGSKMTLKSIYENGANSNAEPSSYEMKKSNKFNANDIKKKVK